MLVVGVPGHLVMNRASESQEKDNKLYECETKNSVESNVIVPVSTLKPPWKRERYYFESQTPSTLGDDEQEVLL